MPIKTDSLNRKLYSLLQTRGYNPDPKDSDIANAGKTVPPEEADVFHFIFKQNGKSIDDVWVSIEKGNLVLYYDKDIEEKANQKTPNLDYDDSWFGFLQFLKSWAKNKQLSFELEPKEKLDSQMAQRTYMKKQERISEAAKWRQGMLEGESSDEKMKDVVSYLYPIIQDYVGNSGNRQELMRTIFKEMPDKIKQNSKLFRKAFNKAYDAIYGPEEYGPEDDFNFTDYSMRQGEMGSPDRLREGVAEGPDKLQGTPVVSLSDFSDKDDKKDKYGRTVPKKLKKDDPRVKFHKDEKQGVAEGSLNEFAPPGSDDGDDGFSEETLKRLAAQWYNGNEDPRVERTLMAAGWEIGQDEGYDDEPGVFVVQAGDVNGNSYLSWPAHELKQGVAEGYWQDALKKAEADRAARQGKSFKKNPASHDKKGVYIGDKDLAGNPVPKRKEQGVAEDNLKEFAPGSGGGSGDYFQALASAWYNGTFDSGSLEKGIKSQQDVERLLNRGIIGPDGVTRKYAIAYNSTFDGVVISSDDYYEHSDYNDQGQEVDSRNGQPWGPNDYMEFSDDDLSEGVAEGSLNEGQYEMMMRNGQVKKFVAKDDADAKRIAAGHGAKSVIRLKGGVPAGKVSEQGVDEGLNEMDSEGYKGTRDDHEDDKGKKQIHLGPKHMMKAKDIAKDAEKELNKAYNKQKVEEGYYPMGKSASYNDAIPTVKIVLQHTRQIQEGEQRYRNVARIFLENQQGERILCPSNKPGIAQVYARHLAEGGVPNDERWNHIKGLCEEYSKMAGFVRAVRGNQFNESAQKLVEAGLNHYQNLRESLGKMRGHRGYTAYFESWTPTLMEDESDEGTLNELFVQETLDPRIESVMPILNRLKVNLGEMKEISELSEWADNLLEGGDGGEASEEPVEQLEEAPGAETLAHNQQTEKQRLKAFDLDEDEIDDAEVARKKMDTPAYLRKEKGGDWKITPKDIDAMAAGTRTTSKGLAAHAKRIGLDDDEEQMEESGLQAYLGNKKYGKEGMDALRKAGREHASKEKMAKIRAKYDKLDELDLSEDEFAGDYKTGPAGQWRNKGPKKNQPAKVGDLVGASESFINTTQQAVVAEESKDPLDEIKRIAGL